MPKDGLVDLSSGGIHHSWEEDIRKFPLGNIVYELQLNVMDEVSTIRNFDKGKISSNGTLRPLQIEDYFSLIDRSAKANNPENLMASSQLVLVSEKYIHERLLKTKYYTLEKIKFLLPAAITMKINRFRHIFVKEGKVEIGSGNTTLKVSSGHSVFIPAEAREFTITNNQKKGTVLISY